ncbi:hypothetical protein [Paenibacillus agri]|uniref:Uncharacterized protein n=1 Tax=Paenibacillus agri TaxID=2744309 RepID=A0A850ENV4_9BACL|nr:hypothetical protein [Paenibacillus agri]NUU61450.1 hypothetical protein [Paenibacillus agri]
MAYIVGLIVLLVLTGVYVIFLNRTAKRKNERSGMNSKVISMESHRRAKHSSGEQLCSSCKKKNGKLIFYAQDNGTVVGLCKDCKAQAKKRDMLPL